MANDQHSGSTWREPFAWFDPDSCSWKMCQGSLLEDSGESCTTWPRQGTWDLGFAWELATSAPPTDASASSSLLPTPDGAVFNDGQSTEAYLERKRRELEKGYNGNGGGTSLAMTSKLLHEGIDPDEWKGQLLPTPVTSDGRGLTDGDSREGGSSLREIEELLPSPTAWLGRRPENAMADPERAASRQHEGTRGKRSIELPDALAMLPTPTTQDAANTAGPSQLERNTPPLNAVAPTLLPTPAAADGDGGRLDSKETFESGKRPSGTKATRTLRSTLHHRLLPTPTAEDGERGQGADAARQWGPSLRGAVQQPDLMLPTPRVTTNRSGRGAMVENQQWSAPGLEQVAEMAMGKLPHEFESVEEVPGASRSMLLPTPVANPENPGAGGELRAALEHGPGRRNETGVDSMGRPNTGRPSRMLPTPTAGDAASSGSRNLPGSKAHAGVSLTDAMTTGGSTTPRRGDPTSPPSDDGKPSSDDVHPDQLTIEAG